ncbi:MAG TPA: GGDEF domain-containing protein [Pirellulaceae bacterium]|jgi:diguanylate cyclase (GGDEF)-like protein|nr:GGDEF domain-containing protein [Pirellulaceae bacterium]
MSILILSLLAAAALFAGGVLCGRLLPRSGAQPNLDRESLAVLHEIATKLSRDVQEHETQVRILTEDLEALPAPDESDVAACVRQIVEASDCMRRKLREAEARLEEQARMMREQAIAARTDALTLLRNRGALDDYLDERLDAANERSEPTSLVLLDVDHFKRVNDAHGHLAGDAVLRAVAKALTDAAPKDAFVARYGGEEFAIVLPNRTASESRDVAEAIRARVGETSTAIDDKRLRVTASAGLAEALPGEDLASWIRRVDEGLYDAKARGRNIGIWRRGDGMLPLADAGSEREDGGAPIFDRRAQRTSTAEVAGLDPVTGLSNRASFTADVKRRLAQLRRTPGQATLTLLRIDGYDEMIAKRGFRAAEQALLFVSQALRISVRDTDHIARYGRDMFAALLPEATAGDADSVVARIRGELARPFASVDGVPLRITASFAAAELDTALEVESIFANCREALDHAELSADLVAETT